MLESYSKGKTTDALKSLMKMVPKTATIIEKDLTGNEKEKIVSIEDININNIILLILEFVLCNIHAAIDANSTINTILITVINKEFPNTFIKSNCSHALV